MTTRRDLLAAAVSLASLAVAGRVVAQSAPPSMATFWRAGDPGERLELRGQVLDPAGQPLPGATLVVWQADGSGVYTDNYRGTLVTDQDGAYVLRTALPGNYGAARHIHMAVSHEAHGTLNTRVLFKGDPALSAAMEEFAIVLDETSMGGERVWIGAFDITMGAR